MHPAITSAQSRRKWLRTVRAAGVSYWWQPALSPCATCTEQEAVPERHIIAAPCT